MDVSLTSVSKTFGAVRAVASVSASFRHGHIHVIVGANGSGKTTLLHIIGTLARPTGGEIVHGSAQSGPDVRAQLGWVGHDAMCYGDLSGWENIELSARLRGIDPAGACRRAGLRFQMSTFASRPVRTLSRGQRQRVALARALVHEPSLVLLDEPTTGLDVAGAAALSEVIRDEAARGAAVVLVTHDMPFAERVGGVVYTMDRGRLSLR